MASFRGQSGDYIAGKWEQGSFDVALNATDLEGAKEEIDSRLADGEGTAFETGETIRVIGNNGQSASRKSKFENDDASWS